MSKNVLITGATSGIGEATARAFAEEGENLILTGRRVERLEALKEELQATYPNQKVWTFALDVTDMAMVKDVCQAILKSVGQVHVLVNNAGLALGLTAYQDYEEWDMLTMLDTNVKGLMMVTRQILPSMVAAMRVISSIWALRRASMPTQGQPFTQLLKPRLRPLVMAFVSILLPQISR